MISPTPQVSYRLPRLKTCAVSLTMSAPSKIIQAHESLPWINTKGAIKAFGFRFGNAHAYGFTKSRFLDAQYHPLKSFFNQRYASRDEPLWWSCISRRQSGRSDRVARSWLARRGRNAFVESLRKKGYDADGRPLPGTGNESDLYGTASIIMELPALKMSYEELGKQTDIAVSVIIRHQRGSGSRNGQDGRTPFNKPWDKEVRKPTSAPLSFRKQYI